MGGRQETEKCLLIEGFLSLVKRFPLEEQRNIIASLSTKFYTELLTPDKILVPASIFSFSLGAFESICKYLVENLKLSPKEISSLTGRSLSTIENTLRKAKQKHASTLDDSEKTYLVPLSVINKSKTGIQESIVGYLHDEFRLQFNQISAMLKRNYQTIRTAYLKYVEKTAE